MNPDILREVVGAALVLGVFVALYFKIRHLYQLKAEWYPKDPEGSSDAAREGWADQPKVAISTSPDEPIAFGYKIAWLAVRSTDMNHVARVVGLTELQAANWETGLESAFRGHHVFVSPPVEGWIFVAGIRGREPAVHLLEAWEEWMNEIAAEFSEVHYFGSHQVSDFYAWARYVDGRELRAYSSAGEVYVDRGSPAAAEQLWRQNGEIDDCGPGDEDVLRVAAEWGFDPMTLEDRDYPPGVGLVGRLAI